MSGGEERRGDGELPEGWRYMQFSDLVENHDGKRVPVRAGDRAERQGKYPYYGASGVIDQVEDFLFDGDYLLIAEDGANLLSRSTPIAFQAHGRFWVNNHAHVVQPLNGSPLGYLESYLNSIDLAPHVTGTAQPKLTQRALNQLQVPVAPVPEQRRIVAKLESLQACSRRVREVLEAVPALLEKLRQSILAAAFRGDLTADWRAQHPDVEPASELLKRIRIERRKKWEAAELAKLKAKGKTPKDDKWKQKYVEPEPVDDSDLPDLPEGWGWASVEELLVGGPSNGFSPKSDAASANGTPTLRLSATTSGRCILNETTTKRTATPVPPDAQCWLHPGDVLLQRANTLEYVGVSAVYDGPDRAYIYPDLMMRLRPSAVIGPFWLWKALSTTQSRAFMRVRATGTAGNMPKVNGETVRCVPIPLAPAAEQVVLSQVLNGEDLSLQRLESLLALCLAEATQLDSSILSKAFRGELVPQDPNDVTETLIDTQTTPDVSAPTQAKKTAKPGTRAHR